MSIPTWRYVRYVDDGVSMYQCLSCYEEWQSVTSPRQWAFCPYCGVCWDGQQKCIPHDEKWEKYYGKWNQYQHPYCWVIEELKVYSQESLESGTNPNEQWRVKKTLDGRYSAKSVLDELKYIRAEEFGSRVKEWFVYEYRARLIPFADLEKITSYGYYNRQYYSGSNPCWS